jgi:hypothetical protein
MRDSEPVYTGFCVVARNDLFSGAGLGMPVGQRRKQPLIATEGFRIFFRPLPRSVLNPCVKWLLAPAAQGRLIQTSYFIPACISRPWRPIKPVHGQGHVGYSPTSRTKNVPVRLRNGCAFDYLPSPINFSIFCETARCAFLNVVLSRSARLTYCSCTSRAECEANSRAVYGSMLNDAATVA